MSSFLIKKVNYCVYIQNSTSGASGLQLPFIGVTVYQRQVR